MNRRSFLASLTAVLGLVAGRSAAADGIVIVNSIGELPQKKSVPTLVKQGRMDDLLSLYVLSGRMISGVPDDQWFDRQVDLMARVSPRINNVLIPVKPGDPGSHRDAIRASNALKRRSMTPLVVELGAPPYVLSPVSRSIDQVDAILFLPIVSLTDDHWMKLWLTLSLQQKTPLFGAWREEQLDQGFLGGSVITKLEYQRLITHAQSSLDKNGHLPPPDDLMPKTTPLINKRLLPYYSLQITERP